MPDNQFRLTGKILQQRLQEHGSLGYVTTYNFMKGIVLANAALTLTILLGLSANSRRPPTLAELPFDAIALWVASLLFVAVTYYATIVGMFVTLWVLNVADIVLPFLLVIAEFCLFSLLQSDGAVRFWSASFGFASIIVAGILQNVAGHLNREVEGDSEQINTSLKAYSDKQTKYARISVVIGIVAVILAFATDRGTRGRGAVALLAITWSAFALREQSKTAKLLGVLASPTRPLNGGPPVARPPAHPNTRTS